MTILQLCEELYFLRKGKKPVVKYVDYNICLELILSMIDLLRLKLINQAQFDKLKLLNKRDCTNSQLLLARLLYKKFKNYSK